MVFNDLPIGAEFCFGKIKKTQYSRTPDGRHVSEVVDVPLVWKKTALNGLSVGIRECGYAAFDYPHDATGSNRYMRNHGHRLFFLSSLYKYLNTADTSWKNVSTGDRPPRYDDNGAGFLSKFSDEEIRLIEPHNMKVEVPVGYTKQYGTEVTKSVLVGIPSLEEIGDAYSSGTFQINVPQKSTWLSDADTMSKYISYGHIRRMGGDGTSNIMPVIKLKDDAPVDVLENGKYIIRIPESDFSGDIAAFLGFECEAAA